MTPPFPPPPALIIGGGMITHDQILPSLYHLQRLGVLGEITVCAQRPSTVRKLLESPTLRDAFPQHTFRAFPSASSIDDAPQPQLYRDVLRCLRAESVVFLALPDHLHFSATLDALETGHHAIVVKPLVLTVAESRTLEKAAFERGLFLGIEYHKRFDDRSLMARDRYRSGRFGEFRLGHAHLHEKWHYRHSNFQNWCTTDKSDAFSYIGCHYVDLVTFITGLKPAAVSVYGIIDRYPNGNAGYLYTDARVLFENGAALNVQNSLSAPDALPGSNTQGLTMYMSGGEKGGFLRHSDQYRGLEYCELTGYCEPSPDYLQLVGLGGEGLTPVGYGYRSLEQLTRHALSVAALASLSERQNLLQRIDREGLIATPANSRYNEAVLEAARRSLASNGALIELPAEAVA